MKSSMEVMDFLKANGHIILYMSNTLSLQQALCNIMGDPTLRQQMINYFQLEKISDIHLEYFLMDDDAKQDIINAVAQNFNAKDAIHK